MSADDSSGASRLWHGKPSLWALVLIALGLPIAFPEFGFIASFVIAVAAAVIARKYGSFGDMGFRWPASWPKLIGTTLIYGLVIQFGFTVVVEPGLARMTGDPVDISVFDGMRGDFAAYLVLLAIGWAVGGFLEEFTFRGFIAGRVSWLLGSGNAANWIAVLVAAVPFGIAHLYQGVTGMIATGMVGIVLGAVYVCHRFNIWYAIFTHGFVNTVGFTAMYLDIDRELQRWLF